MPLIAFGMTSSRRVSTRSAVASAEGAVVGITVKTAAVPDLSTFACETALTPCVLRDLVLEVDERGSLAVDFRNCLLLVVLLLLLVRRL